MSRRVPLTLVLALALTSTSRLAAQRTAPTRPIVSGRVVDTAGTALQGAAVVLADAEGREALAESDGEGRFAVPARGRGRHVLTVSALGYRIVSRPVDVGRESVTVPDLVLRPRPTQAPVIVIGRGDAGDARHLAAADMLSVVSVMTGEQVAREQVDFAQELLRKVSGVYHADFNQGIVSGDIGMRGFNTEGDAAHVRILVDGVPMNLNSGFGEINSVAPLEIERIEVVRGTSDARYGLFNIAGNVNVTTKRGGNSVMARLASGSFGTSEAQGIASVTRGIFSQTLSGAYRTADGYRDHSGLTRTTASGKWFLQSGDGRRALGLVARMNRTDTDAPGYLSFAQSRATPRLSPAFSASDGGDITMRHLSLHADLAPTASSFLTVRAYGQSFDRNRFVRFTAAGAQQERREDENQYGLASQLTIRPTALARLDGVLSLGADWQTQDNLQQRFRTADRVRSATLRDYDFTFSNTGGFAQLDLAPVPAVRVHAGVRADAFGGDFTNKATGTALALLDYGTVWQPKLGAVVTPRAGWSAYANFGRSFQIGTGIAAYGTQPLAPSVNDGWEVGLITAPFSRVTVRGGVWRQTATDEVRLRFDNSGDSENIGETERRGIDLEGTLSVGGGASVWGAWTSQRATLVEPGRTQPQLRGKRLNHVPDWTMKAGVDWTHRSGLAVSAWTYGQDDYFLTPANDLPRFGGYLATNLDLSWRWRATTLGVAVQNLFDRYYEYAWFDGAQTLHSPANGRSALFTVTVQR